jgi:hypothetical protein
LKEYIDTFFNEFEVPDTLEEIDEDDWKMIQV